jgi:hypothetical protein
VLGVQRETSELSGDALACKIDNVLITDELRKRPSTKTDYLREKLAIQDLALQMTDHPADVLPRLVALAMELCELIRPVSVFTRPRRGPPESFVGTT